MKVLVVSNHAIIRESLISLLTSLPVDERVDSSSCNALDAREHARLWAPDLILIDMTADDESGALIVRALSASVQTAHIVALGKDGDETSVYQAIQAGADGYLNAETSIDALARTLTGVMKGELGLSRAVALRVIQKLRGREREPLAPAAASLQVKLTTREQEVFDLVRQGLRSREIGERLVIAESTVYKHIQNILDKLRVHSRAQAIFLADSDVELSTPVNPGRSLRSRPPRRSSVS